MVNIADNEATLFVIPISYCAPTHFLQITLHWVLFSNILNHPCTFLLNEPKVQSRWCPVAPSYAKESLETVISLPERPSLQRKTNVRLEVTSKLAVIILVMYAV